MKREDKAALVEEMAAQLRETPSIFAVDYRGITVPEAAELRARLSDADATLRVVKNRLARRAAEEAGTDGLTDVLEGPTALTLVKGDPVAAAKAIFTFAREHDVPTYKGGLMDGAPLDSEQFGQIARLPGVDVLRGQLVGVAASPLTGMARSLGAMLSGVAVALGEIHQKGLVGGAGEGNGAQAPEAAAAREEAETDDAEQSGGSAAPAEDSEDSEKEE